MPKRILGQEWINHVLKKIILSGSGFVAYYFDDFRSNDEKKSMRKDVVQVFRNQYRNAQETEASLDEHIFRILSNMNRNRKRSEGITYEGVTFPDLMGHEDINKPGAYNRTYIHGSTLMLPANFTRQAYENEAINGDSKYTFNRGKSCYVRDAIYPNIDALNDAFVFDLAKVDAQRATMVFDTLTGEGSTTTVEITRIDKRNACFRKFVAETYKVLCRIKPNARYLKYRGMNSRHNMFTLGWKHMFNKEFDGPEPYVETPGVRYYSNGQEQTMMHLGNLLAAFFESKFPNFCESIKETESAAGLDRLVGEFFNQIDFSRNLGGNSHYDLGDGSPGIGVWWAGGEMNIDNINWYFLFPNASINGSRGVAIKLMHGMMIKWDGRMIKHCTFHPGDVPRETTLFGAFVCARHKFTKEYIESPKLNNMPIADPMQVERYRPFLDQILQEDNFPPSEEVTGV